MGRLWVRLQADLREFIELLNFPSLEVLLKNKKAAGRTKDLADVEALRLPDEDD
jgi:hypothetical protein